MTDFLPTQPLLTTSLDWDPRLAYEVALRLEPAATIATRYGLSEGEFQLLANHKPFVETVKEYARELSHPDNKTRFRRKVALAAEELLKEAFTMAKDPAIPAVVRADLIKWHAKCADLEPNREKEGSEGPSSPFTVVIQFPGASAERSVTLKTVGSHDSVAESSTSSHLVEDVTPLSIPEPA